MGNYALDNGWEHERDRLASLEGVFDPGTTRHLDAIGVRRGWSCLEVGGGGGSITAWLCRRVGEAGKVVATDIDPRFLDALDYPADQWEAGDLALTAARCVPQQEKPLM